MRRGYMIGIAIPITIILLFLGKLFYTFIASKQNNFSDKHGNVYEYSMFKYGSDKIDPVHMRVVQELEKEHDMLPFVIAYRDKYPNRKKIWQTILFKEDENTWRVRLQEFYSKEELCSFSVDAKSFKVLAGRCNSLK